MPISQDPSCTLKPPFLTQQPPDSCPGPALSCCPSLWAFSFYSGPVPFPLWTLDLPVASPSPLFSSAPWRPAVHAPREGLVKPPIPTVRRMGCGPEVVTREVLCSGQHAGSAGTLLDFEQPPHPRGLQTEGEGAAPEAQEEEEVVEEEEEDEEEEEEEQEQAFQVSLEALVRPESSKKGPGPEPPGSDEEEEEEEESLAVAEQGKGRRESEGSKSCRRPNGQSPASTEKRLSAESFSSLPEVDPDPVSGFEQEVFAAEGPCPEEMHLDSESLEVLEKHLDIPQELLENPGDMVDFVVPESTEDLKTLSSEEEEEEEELVAAQEPESLLPPSVLDQASVIAERFVSGISRRSSLALEDGKSSGFGSPRLASRSNSILSLDGSEKGLGRHGSLSDSLSTQLPQDTDSGAGGPTENGSSVNGMEAPDPSGPPEPCKKKESTLSTRDRQLLDRIKTYYENAEHHDAGFSIRRRESLSYIPKGLVRNSVSRFNNLPRPDPEPLAPLGHKRQTGSRPASWALFEFPGPSQAGPGDPAPITDSEFRPSSEMVKLWEGMESSRGSPRKGPGSGHSNGLDLHEPLFILEEHELGAITEESATGSPESSSPTERSSPAHLAQELKELVKELSSNAQGGLVTPLHPRIVQLSHIIDGHMSEKVKNKVYQLARQYSLRIKSKSATDRSPLPWEKATSERDQKSPANPQLQQEAGEYSGGKGKRRPVLSLFYPESPTGPEHSPPKSTAGETSPRYFSSSSSAASPRTTSPGSRASTRNPLSPLDTETFNWPDVRELCSKYAANDEAPLAEGSRPWAPPVNRSRSVPENMVEPPQSARVGRCCSLSTKRGQAGPRGPGDSPQHDSDREDDLYVTAHVTLDNNQRVIIMEKEPPPGSALEDSEGLHSLLTMPWQGQDFREYGLKEEGPRDSADPSQQGRVRNLREKFQALNSIG